MRLLDSNIIIYAALPEYAGLRLWLAAPCAVSAITLVEVLGYHGLDDEALVEFELWFERMTVHQVTEAVLRQAATVRRQHRLKLGDAIIAATALEHGLELVTRNVADFKNIPGLTLTNPVDNPP
ncbi:MAG: type II toxin-antitoxin system VapC family toxin [Prosthecobacter sp.]|nr:type II toxin-antitoxin system VapC family toxin [Prosthecobacter sp.]